MWYTQCFVTQNGVYLHEWVSIISSAYCAALKSPLSPSVSAHLLCQAIWFPPFSHAILPFIFFICAKCCELPRVSLRTMKVLLYLIKYVFLVIFIWSILVSYTCTSVCEVKTQSLNFVHVSLGACLHKLHVGQFILFQAGLGWVKSMADWVWVWLNSNYEPKTRSNPFINESADNDSVWKRLCKLYAVTTTT